jgi:hypothetical protein
MNGTAVRVLNMRYTYILKMADREYYVDSTNDIPDKQDIGP